MNSPLGRHHPTHLTAEVDIVLKFCPGSNSGQLEEEKENKKACVSITLVCQTEMTTLEIVRVPGGQWVGVEGFNVVRLTILGFLIRSAINLLKWSLPVPVV